MQKVMIAVVVGSTNQALLSNGVCVACFFVQEQQEKQQQEKLWTLPIASLEHVWRCLIWRASNGFLVTITGHLLPLVQRHCCVLTVTHTLSSHRRRHKC